MKIRHDELEKRLAWLTKNVSVEGPFASRVPGVTASNLPGAGQG